MKSVFLNMKRANPVGRMVLAICAIAGDPGELRGVGRTFTDVQEVAEALRAAGIPDHRYELSLGAVDVGYGSFIEVTESEADALSLLSREARQ